MEVYSQYSQGSVAVKNNENLYQNLHQKLPLKLPLHPKTALSLCGKSCIGIALEKLHWNCIGKTALSLYGKSCIEFVWEKLHWSCMGVGESQCVFEPASKSREKALMMKS